MTKRHPRVRRYFCRACYAAASIRAEGWIVRRLSPDCWKVSDHRRCTVACGLRRATRRRHFYMNGQQLAHFAFGDDA